MNVCKFIKKFNKLKKSSSDSIDNILSFDDFRKYMHVIRATEIDLKSILSAVNSSNKKTLILLCGSAGDVKSHLLSYLKNSDSDHLLDGYKVFNDATESNAPNKTAVQTLYKRLEDFNDDNISTPGSNAIIAINLGVLSNFIESEYASNFSFLKEYVRNSNIMTSEITNTTYVDNSNFQHISFSDYHMFSMDKGEVGNNDEIILTPLHPINVAYQLALCSEKGIEEAADMIVERLNSLNLLPYIKKKKTIFKVSDQQNSLEWKYYASVENKKYHGNWRFVPKLIDEKVTEFISHFRYIFNDINNKTIKINLINMGDCSEVRI